MSTNVVLFFFSFVLVSCGTGHKDGDISFAGVDLNKSIKINSKPFISSKRSNLNSLGPIVDGEELSSEEVSSVVAVVLGDSLYKSFSYLPVLECLKREGVKYHYVSGLGFASLIASLYALDGSVETIEWKVHKLARLISNEEPYSESWNRKVIKFVSNEVPIKRIEQSSKPLLFTSYHFKEKKIELKSRGDVKESIMANLSFNRLINNNKTPLQSSPSSALQKYRELADYIIYINAIGSKIRISRLGGFPLSYYTKQVGYLENEETGSDLDLKIQLEEYELDNIKNLNDIVDGGREFCRKHATDIAKLFTNEKVITE